MTLLREDVRIRRAAGAAASERVWMDGESNETAHARPDVVDAQQVTLATVDGNLAAVYIPEHSIGDQSAHDFTPMRSRYSWGYPGR
jgi:hypothetical protein